MASVGPVNERSGLGEALRQRGCQIIPVCLNLRGALLDKRSNHEAHPRNGPDSRLFRTPHPHPPATIATVRSIAQ
jgi:hypothetical protein